MHLVGISCFLRTVVGLNGIVFTERDALTTAQRSNTLGD